MAGALGEGGVSLLAAGFFALRLSSLAELGLRKTGRRNQEGHPTLLLGTAHD
jgi:hypothetical protein